MIFYRKARPIKRSKHIDLEIFDSSHQDRWVDVRSTSRDFLSQWEPKWDDGSDKPHAFRNRLKLHQEEWQNKRGIGLLMILNNDKSRPVVGGINISNIRYGVNMSASLGYWTGEKYVRQGYMFEGLNLTLDFCFQILKLRRVEAATLLDNIPSQNLLKKIGFQEEGISREMLCIDGQWQDHRRFALLYSDSRSQVENC